MEALLEKIITDTLWQGFGTLAVAVVGVVVFVRILGALGGKIKIPFFGNGVNGRQDLYGGKICSKLDMLVKVSERNGEKLAALLAVAEGEERVARARHDEAMRKMETVERKIDRCE
jgi:hypothetical protein